MRAAITGGQKIEAVFRRQRGRFLQDEALALVEAGETSVQEIKRVMKPGEANAPQAAPGAGEGARAPKPKPPTRPAAAKR
jgi:hypothetical protein